MTGALMKMLSTELPATFITWFRFSGYFLILLPIVFRLAGANALRPPRPHIQFARGLCLAGATVAFVAGARTLDYADAIAILYAYPFFLIILAAVVLKESLQRSSVIGVFGGFAGVLMVVRPQFDSLDVGAMLVLICALLVSIQMTINRKLGAIANPLVTSTWGALVAAVVTTPLVVANWPTLDSRQFVLLCLVAVSGAIGQTSIVAAFSKAPASELAPYTYFEIVAAVVIGLLVFGTLPDLWAWAGIGLIVVCGIYISISHRVRTPPRRLPKI